MVIGKYTMRNVRKISLPATVTEEKVDLVKISVSELGVRDGAPYTMVCVAAHAKGLSLCTAETALALREQYVDQPDCEFLWVAMTPIAESKNDDEPCIFVLSNDSEEGTQLSRSGTKFEYGCHLSQIFIFTLKK